MKALKAVIAEVPAIPFIKTLASCIYFILKNLPYYLL